MIEFAHGNARVDKDSFKASCSPSAPSRNSVFSRLASTALSLSFSHFAREATATAAAAAAAAGGRMADWLACRSSFSSLSCSVFPIASHFLWPVSDVLRSLEFVPYRPLATSLRPSWALLLPMVVVRRPAQWVLAFLRFESPRPPLLLSSSADVAKIIRFNFSHREGGKTGRQPPFPSLSFSVRVRRGREVRFRGTEPIRSERLIEPAKGVRSAAERLKDAYSRRNISNASVSNAGRRD